MNRESLIRNYKLTSVERVLSVFLLAIGIGMYIIIQTKLTSASKSSVINNPGFFPSIVAVGFVVMSVILFLSTFNKRRTETVTVNWFGIMIVLIWVVFALLCKPIGFILSGILALTATLFLFGVRKKLTLILTGIIAPVVVYLMLGVLMGVRLPTLFL